MQNIFSDLEMKKKKASCITCDLGVAADAQLTAVYLNLIQIVQLHIFAKHGFDEAMIIKAIYYSAKQRKNIKFLYD